LKRPRMSQLELVGVWLALFILASVAALAYRSIGAASETLGWVEHTDLVLRQIRDVSAAYARATSARRAYVVAGDEAQLAELPELDAHLARAMADMRGSVADSPGQARRVESLT
jgi:CHASE3 domain sensor protein